MRLPILTICVFFVLLSSVFVSASVGDVRPRINVVFEEKVVLLGYFLKNTETGVLSAVDLVSSVEEKAFVFVPSQALQNGNYRFSVQASDLVGNSKTYDYSFDVFVPDNKIFLVKPNSIGVANSTRFQVGIETLKPAVCKYTGVYVPSFNDARLKLFDSTGDISENIFVEYHQLDDYSVDPDFPKDFFVVCRDELGRDKSKQFILRSDVTAPTLKSVVFNPSPIVEYPESGVISSLLGITASEPVVCKYSQNPESFYGQMDFFSGYALNDYGDLDFNTYQAYNEELMTDFPSDVVKDSFKFYIQCEDRAGFRSVRFEKSIDVDLSEGLKIQVLSPPSFTGSSSVFLNVSTNKRASCRYKASSSSAGDPTSYSDPSSYLLTSTGDLSKSHFRNLGKKPDGSYKITIFCEVPEGVSIDYLSAEKEHTFKIDTVPPSKPVVAAKTPVCDNTLSASFSANDSSSAISRYIWKVGYTGLSMANGSTSGDDVSVSAYNNRSSFTLVANQAYYFGVRAVDAAGNIGEEGVSNKITFDASGLGCDTTPPVVTLLKASEGNSVSFDCQDDVSGCTSVGSFYGSSYEQPCNSTTSPFLYPFDVPLYKTTIFCWSVKDKAGNLNAGSRIVDFNLSLLGPEILNAPCPSGIDNDGDGYGERCLLGPDCDDTDKLHSVGCINGCVQDLDGDGYGIGCAAGNDCNGRNENLTTSCPNNCISDNDGDAYGLGCDNGPDCRGDDSTLTVNCPNGCIDDNDADSYGLACPVGFDCHGEDKNMMRTCTNYCIQDTDGDGYGMGCSSGPDCDGRNPSLSVGCSNGCYFDEDGDGYGFGCSKGIDCNGMNPFKYMDCPNNCVSDNDGDGYGWGCDSGSDCNDTDPYVNVDCSFSTKCRYDHDGDAIGLGCLKGADCDDYKFVFINCTSGCTFDIDCNGIPDEWQELYFNSSTCMNASFCGRDADPDRDSYSNIEEYRRGTNPVKKDSLDIPAEQSSEASDSDHDGISDACERMYGLRESDGPEDDADGDGLSNSFECRYKKGMCINSLNPSAFDTDADGYSDKEELDADTDPCDDSSYPSGLFIPLLLIIVGLFLFAGSLCYLVYKKYYVPLASPPKKPTAVPRAGAVSSVSRQSGVAMPGVHHPLPRRFTPRKLSGPIMSHHLLEQELKKRAEEREKILTAFGQRKQVENASKVMEKIARKPAEVKAIKIPVKQPAAQPVKEEDHVKKLSRIIGPDYFDRISDLTTQQANYFEKLAKIAKDKSVGLDEDNISKLAMITKKAADDKIMKKDIEAAFRKSAVDDLGKFLGSKKRVDSFIKEQGVGSAGKGSDAFDELSKMGGEKKSIDALEALSEPKRRDVIDALNEITSKKAKEAALSSMESLSSAESKDEIFRAFRQMSREKHIDKNVFEVVLSYLLKSSKITKHDVSEIIFSLQEQGVLDKKDVAEVFFNLGMK